MFSTKKTKQELLTENQHLKERIKILEERELEYRSQEKAAKASEELEKLVQIRTRKFEAINQQLQNDIEKRKLVEKALIEEKERAQKVLDIAGVTLVLLGPDQRIQLINKYGCNLLKIGANDAVGLNWFDNFIPPEIRDEVKLVFDKLIQGEITPVEYFENEIVTTEGARKLLVWHNAVIRNDEGEIVSVLSSGLDITDRHIIENKLYRKNALLKARNTIFNSSFNCKTEKELAQTSLAIIESLTSSAYCVIAEIKENNKFDVIAITKRTWEAWSDVGINPPTDLTNMEVQGIFSVPLTENRAFFTNDIQSHPKYIGIPKGHPEIHNMMAIPLLHKQDVFGLLAVANKGTDYTQEDLDILTEVSVAFIEAFMRKRAELELTKHQQNLEETIEARTASLENVNVQLQKEINERKQNEQALKERDLMVQVLMDAITETILLINPDGKVLTINEQGAKRLGKRVEDVIGRNIFEYFSNNLKRSRKSLCNKAAILKKPIFFEDQRKGVTYLTSVYPVLDGNDNVHQLAIFARDITKRKEAEKKLEDSEKKYRLLIENLQEGIWVIDKNAYTTFVNPRMADMLGYSTENMVGCHLFEFMDEKGKEISRKNLKRRQLGIKERHDFEFIRKDGERIYTQLATSPILDEFNNYIGAVAAVADITEQRKAEEALQEREKQYRLLADNASDMITRHDAEGWYLYLSPAVETVMGFSSEELIGRNAYDFFHPDDVERLKKYHQRIFQESTPGPIEYRILTKSNKFKWVETNVNGIRNEKTGDTQEIICVTRDITDRKKIELKLAETLNELRRSNADLQHFAYVASHDLHEPLRVVRSYLQLIKRRYGNQIDQETDEYIEYAIGGVSQLQQLIEGLLKYSRVQTKGQEFEVTDLESVLQHVLISLSKFISENKATINASPLPEIAVDRIQIHQVFQNLIHNAIKFCKNKNPVINISYTKREKECVICVSDNGIGIEPQFHDQIFTIFNRLHPRDDYEGSGIGLAICKRIIERHGGRIWVESEPGKGASFYFNIPIQNE